MPPVATGPLSLGQRDKTHPVSLTRPEKKLVVAMCHAALTHERTEDGHGMGVYEGWNALDFALVRNLLDKIERSYLPPEDLPLAASRLRE